MPFFQISGMVFRLSWSTAYLLTVVSDRVARDFNRSWATWAVELYISKAVDRVWDAGLLHKLMKFQVRYLALFLLFSVIGSFKWFWMESRHKNIQSILGILEGPFLVLHVFYPLMTFLMMLSVILLSMLIILLFILNVIRHLICGSN